jgi:osmoprotectant transport system substrate-binding protein
MKVHRRFALALGTVALLATAACGGGNKIDSSSASNNSSGSTAKGSVTVSGQDFTEMQVMAAMYDQLLAKAGYTPTTKLVTTRDIYIKQMTNGNVDVVPEYLAGITDFLNTAQNGDSAKPVSSHDPNATLAAVKPLAAKDHITLLKPSQATDQNAFFVTKDFASKNHITTLSQLAALKMPIKLAAGPDCKGRSDCQVGLEKVYGLKLTDIIPTGFGGAATLSSVKSGESQLGETGTTDGTLSAQGLVLLKDDKGIQPAQNLTPAVNTQFLADHPDIAQTLDKLSSVLTTADLAKLNLEVDAQRQKPSEVATNYLTSKGLL